MSFQEVLWLGFYEKIGLCGAKIVPQDEEERLAIEEGREPVKINFKTKHAQDMIRLDMGVTDEVGFANAVANINKENNSEQFWLKGT